MTPRERIEAGAAAVDWGDRLHAALNALNNNEHHGDKAVVEAMLRELVPELPDLRRVAELVRQKALVLPGYECSVCTWCRRAVADCACAADELRALLARVGEKP